MEDQIKELEEEIKAKKLILDTLKKKQKKNILFSQTKIGSALYGAIKTATKPFVNLHMNALEQLADPQSKRSQKLYEKSEKLLEEIDNLTDETPKKKISNLVLRMADHVMAVEDFTEQNPRFEQPFKTSQICLKNAIESFRPPKDPEKEEQLKEIMEQMVNLGYAKEVENNGS